ncbi:peptide deformylase [Halobacteriovorax marinus SJ]|uniref:Peptide deformylase n=1 Tax=Halobacteriovorax marinus (strain ATCC BAA-682 / DSM 15412 / SJ) TaxID=862908 RepID=E1WY27_HALMS|nr:peptide deformylase [Halobacteriovorax marinus]CBW27582.1 peptide deformylase [Halobacteriovorax marinus SJ]
MAIKDLTKMGNPVLRKVALEYPSEEIGGEKFIKLIKDLEDTMKENGGIGIAAPQIGVSYQVAIIQLPDNSERYPDIAKSDQYIVVNPTIEVLDQTEQGFWEGCLSVPGLRGFVHRPRKVKITFLNDRAQQEELILEGFLATVFQHELDHLFGKLYIDRIKDLTLLSYEEEFRQFWQDTI